MIAVIVYLASTVATPCPSHLEVTRDGGTAAEAESNVREALAHRVRSSMHYRAERHFAELTMHGGVSDPVSAREGFESRTILEAHLEYGELAHIELREERGAVRATARLNRQEAAARHARDREVIERELEAHVRELEDGLEADDGVWLTVCHRHLLERAEEAALHADAEAFLRCQPVTEHALGARARNALAERRRRLKRSRWGVTLPAASRQLAADALGAHGLAIALRADRNGPQLHVGLHETEAETHDLLDWVTIRAEVHVEWGGKPMAGPWSVEASRPGADRADARQRAQRAVLESLAPSLRAAVDHVACSPNRTGVGSATPPRHHRALVVTGLEEADARLHLERVQAAASRIPRMEITHGPAAEVLHLHVERISGRPVSGWRTTMRIIDFARRKRLSTLDWSCFGCTLGQHAQPLERALSSLVDGRPVTTRPVVWGLNGQAFSIESAGLLTLDRLAEAIRDGGGRLVARGGTALTVSLNCHHRGWHPVTGLIARVDCHSRIDVTTPEGEHLTAKGRGIGRSGDAAEAERLARHKAMDRAIESLSATLPRIAPPDSGSPAAETGEDRP